MVQMLCHLLECLLTPENTPPDSHKELYELYFVFAAIWAFGGALFQDQVLASVFAFYANTGTNNSATVLDNAADGVSFPRFVPFTGS